MRIQLKNPVLPQHEIETRAGSRPPTHEEIKKFEEIESIKKGCYNASEDKIIVHNWKEFCKVCLFKKYSIFLYILTLRRFSLSNVLLFLYS